MVFIPVTSRVEKGHALSDHEIQKRMAPGGRLPVKGAKSDARGEPAYANISDASPAAIAAAQERHETRAKPELVARRLKAGK
jgi:hypothetical protein